MTLRLRRTAAILAVGIIASIVPFSAQANHCQSRVVIFSSASVSANNNSVSLPAANSNAGACAVDSQHETDYDGRLINPGSTHVSIRYTADLGEGVPTLTAVLNGLGVTNQTVTLKRETFTTGSFVYNSPRVAIDTAKTGCITATVIIAPEDPSLNESTAFHTLGSNC